MKKTSLNACLVKGCVRESQIEKHLLCRAHYMRYYRTGKVGSGEIKKFKKCKPYRLGKD